MERKKVTGRSKGGVEAAKNMTPEGRVARAAKGAAARWGYKATHKGNFKEEFGIDVECYVLNDANKTAVISQRGMGVALGMGVGGSRLPMFVNSKRMTDYVGQELRGKLGNPIVFQGISGGQNSPPPSKVNGYDVTILIDLCKSIVAADSDGKPINPAVAKQAHIILSASAKAGIQGLVYALAGYQPEVEEVIQAFKAFVQAEAKKYESEFPTELYWEWARLYGHKPQRSWKDMHLTINHVYFPLAKSDGKLLALLRDAKGSAGDKNAKLFQFLNLVGARALRFQLGRIYDVAQNAASCEDYEREIAKRFGGQQEFDLTVI